MRRHMRAARSVNWSNMAPNFVPWFKARAAVPSKASKNPLWNISEKKIKVRRTREEVEKTKGKRRTRQSHPVLPPGQGLMTMFMVRFLKLLVSSLDRIWKLIWRKVHFRGVLGDLKPFFHFKGIFFFSKGGVKSHNKLNQKERSGCHCWNKAEYTA